MQFQSKRNGKSNGKDMVVSAIPDTQVAAAAAVAAATKVEVVTAMATVEAREETAMAATAKGQQGQQ
jgi:hypothetical protein